jgi:TRAP-type C4-dicarboxylate transport system permease small subunit
MSIFIKVALMFLVTLAMVWLGYRSFKKLNKKIQNSETWGQILLYSLLLFGICAALFLAGIFLLTYGYNYMVSAK